jgi:hypothetical protein
MALEFTDFGLSPDEVVKEREKALSSFSNVTGPAFQKKVAAERGNLISEAEKSVAQAAKRGQVSAATGDLGQAAIAASRMVPKQGMERDALALQGAGMRADIAFSRQGATLTKFERDTAEKKATAANYIAKQAFNLGYNSKEVALHRNGYLADKGMEQMYYDYQQGRISKDEIMNLQEKFARSAQRYEIESKQILAELKNELELAIKTNDVARAKSRILKAIEIQKNAARDAAQASQFGAIISGVFKVGAVAAATYFGGPAAGAATSTVINAADSGGSAKPAGTYTGLDFPEGGEAPTTGTIPSPTTYRSGYDGNIMPEAVPTLYGEKGLFTQQ